ncbi:MAG TPA: nuclear transport factor 2 family protein [Acidimicrobiales bacterium]
MLFSKKRTGEDPMAVVTRFVEACNRHDVEAIYSTVHPNFDSIQPCFPSRNFTGADQVRKNWRAIFESEPGFRLTVLRSARQGNTVWVELHGAGNAAQVAGIFILGVEGDKIRWARVYSGPVEQVGEEADAARRQMQPS